jgi:hypothetical protein
LGGSASQLAGGAEKMLEHGNQQDEGEAIEQGSQQRCTQPQQQQSAVRNDEAQEPDFGPHLSRAGA